MSMKLVLRFGVAAGLALTAGRAEAAAFQLRENSTVSLGQAFAGAASSADTPATAFTNPAGLTQLTGLQFYGGASLVAPSFTFHGSATSALGLPISGNSGANGGHDAMIPYGYVSYRVNDAFAVGLAITAPFGLQTYYGPDFVGRYQADMTSLQTVDFNPNVAMKITPWLSVGAGISANRATAEFATQINSQTLGFEALGALLPLPDGLFRLRASDDFAVGYNAGALVTIDPATRIGITYRSRIQHNFSGTAQFSVPYPLSLNPGLASGPAGAKFVLPDTATASITHGFTPRITGYLDVSWTDWSVFRNLNVYRGGGQPVAATAENYQDSEAVSVGGSYLLDDRITLRGGAGFDATPTRDAYRTARVPDGNRYLVAIGGSYSVTPRTTIDLSYSHVFVDGARIDEVSATGDVLAGKYDSSIDLVSVGLRAAF